jgi:hypothetical protein
MTPEWVGLNFRVPERTSAVRVHMVAVALIALPLFVGCGATERQRVERAAKERWYARYATCARRSGHLYGCVLQGARIPVELQFTDDFRSSSQHRCFRATPTVVHDVSMTSFGYTCAFGRAR